MLAPGILKHMLLYRNEKNTHMRYQVKSLTSLLTELLLHVLLRPVHTSIVIRIKFSSFVSTMNVYYCDAYLIALFQTGTYDSLNLR